MNGRGIAYGDFGLEFRLRKDSWDWQSSEGETAISCLESYFGVVPDPRAPNATHRLGDLIVMMIAASLCGATSATDFALFAQERKQALSRLIAPELSKSPELLPLTDAVSAAVQRAITPDSMGAMSTLLRTLNFGDKTRGCAP